MDNSKLILKEIFQYLIIIIFVILMVLKFITTSMVRRNTLSNTYKIDREHYYKLRKIMIIMVIVVSIMFILYLIL